ncbi:MAG: hypothetical protein ACLSVD_02530 [Eggerthellaceae bacterium]
MERKGYEVLDRNWSCEGVAGRLDLVAMDEDAIVSSTPPRPTARGRLQRGEPHPRAVRAAGSHLAGGLHPRGRRPVRFDGIDMIVVNAGRPRSGTINKLGSFAESIA